MQIIQKLIPQWHAQHLGLLPGHSVAEIANVFASLALKPTLDVIALYSAVGGMCVMEDSVFWRLWSLAEIIERNTESSPYGVLFSDHLIDSFCYRLKYETDERSSVYVDYGDTHNVPKKLFDGLEKFFDAYARDPLELLQ